MQVLYYVVLPNLHQKGMSPAKCMVRALLAINQQNLSTELKFFAHDEGVARAYMEALEMKPGRAHCMLELSIPHDAEPFLTTIDKRKRFYSIQTEKPSPILPTWVLGIKIYPEPSYLVPHLASVVFKAHTPPAETSFCTSDPGSATSSASSPQKDIATFKVLDEFDLS